MMTTLVALSLLCGIDTLDKVTVGKLSFKAPTSWEKTESETGREWVAPNEAARFAIDVFPVDPARPSKACVKQLVDAVAKDGFDKFEEATLGDGPAMKRVTTDYVGEGEEAKKEENKVTTTMILGCNGHTKWLFTWVSRNREATRFGPLLKRVLESISYVK